jgi:hypothetical protein
MNTTNPVMTRYIRRDAVIEAVQWFPGVEVEGVVDLKNEKIQSGWAFGAPGLPGLLILQPGDWIVKSSAGKWSRYSPEEFAEEYEPAD